MSEKIILKNKFNRVSTLVEYHFIGSPELKPDFLVNDLVLGKKQDNPQDVQNVLKHFNNF